MSDAAAHLSVAAIAAAAARLAAGMDACAAELNALDGTIGDGDLGVTMTRGAQAMTTMLEPPPSDVGQALLKCAQGFTKTSGSTFGTLVATGLMAAARTVQGRTTVPWGEVPALLAAAVAAMQARGKAELGDKTALDALDAVRRAVDGLDDPAAMLDAARAAVRDALDMLRPRAARQGRARIFGERTMGLDDPGMVAVLRVLDALA